MSEDTLPVARWAVGDLVQSKAGGPKMVIDAVSIPSRGIDIGGFANEPQARLKAEASGINYHCIYWTGNKRNRECFAEEGLEDYLGSSK